MRSALALLSVSLLLWVNAPLLCWGVARLLICDEPADSASVALLVSGDRVYDAAAEFYRADTSRRLLMIGRRSNRLEQAGVLEPDVPLKLLRERGVPPETLTGLECDGLDDWQAAKTLGQWLHEHPQAPVALLCDRFDSRRQRWILNSVLSAADAKRVRVCAVHGKKFNEANWQSGGLEGLLSFLNASITLSHAMVMGPGRSDRQEADLSQFVETQPASMQRPNAG
jgi:hypothetical protein